MFLCFISTDAKCCIVASPSETDDNHRRKAFLKEKCFLKGFPNKSILEQ